MLGDWPLSNTRLLQVVCILKISRLVFIIWFKELYIFCGKKFSWQFILWRKMVVSQVWTFHLYFPIPPFIWIWPLVAMRLFWFEAWWSFSTRPSSWRASNPCILQAPANLWNLELRTGPTNNASRFETAEDLCSCIREQNLPLPSERHN